MPTASATFGAQDCPGCFQPVRVDRRGALLLGGSVLYAPLGGFKFDAPTFYAEANAAKKAHVEIGHPHQGKTRNEITAPIIEKKLVSRDEEKKRCHIMAEAVFTAA